MTSIEDIAEESVTVYRPDDTRGVQLTILEFDTVDADEVSPEDEFPEFGDWMPVEDEDGNETYVEMPQGLARLLLDADAEAGDTFEVLSVSKGVDGRWRFEGGLVD